MAPTGSRFSKMSCVISRRNISGPTGSQRHSEEKSMKLNEIKSDIAWATPKRVVIHGLDLCDDIVGKLDFGQMAFLQLFARDRKSVVSGKRVSVRVDLGGRRIIKKKKKPNHNCTNQT